MKNERVGVDYDLRDLMLSSAFDYMSVAKVAKETGQRELEEKYRARAADCLSTIPFRIPGTLFEFC
jgi:hypothetical protein